MVKYCSKYMILCFAFRAMYKFVELLYKSEIGKTR